MVTSSEEWNPAPVTVTTVPAEAVLGLSVTLAAPLGVAVAGGCVATGLVAVAEGGAVLIGVGVCGACVGVLVAVAPAPVTVKVVLACCPLLWLTARIVRGPGAAVDETETFSAKPPEV